MDLVRRRDRRDHRQRRRTDGREAVLSTLVRTGAQRTKAALVLAAAAATSLVLYTRNPASGGIFPPCPFHALTGFDCPGCGTLRALHELSHAHFSRAFGLNPLAVLALPLIAYAGVSTALELAGRHALPAIRAPRRTWWIVPAIVIAFWVLRNLPWAPVAWMSSYH